MQRGDLMKKKLLFLFVTFILLFSYHIPLSQAATTDTSVVNVGITGGALSITSPVVTSDFGDVTLDGTVQTLNATLDKLTTSDASGAGAGWRVTVKASQFLEVGGAGLTLPSDSLSLLSPTSVVPVGGTTSASPTFNAGSPWVIDGTSSVSIISAATNTGMGNFDITFPANTLSLTLDPATTYVDNVNFPATPTPFSSTLTWTIISGP